VGFLVFVWFESRYYSVPYTRNFGLAGLLEILLHDAHTSSYLFYNLSFTLSETSVSDKHIFVFHWKEIELRKFLEMYPDANSLAHCKGKHEVKKKRRFSFPTIQRIQRRVFSTRMAKWEYSDLTKYIPSILIVKVNVHLLLLGHEKITIGMKWYYSHICLILNISNVHNKTWRRESICMYFSLVLLLT